MLVGALLGRRAGALSVLTYLTEGAFGILVFAEGSAGITILMGPTGGYFFGFVIQAYLSGWVQENYSHSKRGLAIGPWIFCRAQLGHGYFVGTQFAPIQGV